MARKSQARADSDKQANYARFVSNCPVGSPLGLADPCREPDRRAPLSFLIADHRPGMLYHPRRFDGLIVGKGFNADLLIQFSLCE